MARYLAIWSPIPHKYPHPEILRYADVMPSAEFPAEAGLEGEPAQTPSTNSQKLMVKPAAIVVSKVAVEVARSAS